MMDVCKSPDAYTMEQEVDRATALWRVELSNGEVIVQDDHRPGVEPFSAWERLAGYVAEHHLSIRRIWLQFRSNTARDFLPADADGYFFCKAGLAVPGSQLTQHFYLLGSLQSGKLMVQRWLVPALCLDGVEERDPATAGPCLIMNPKRENASQYIRVGDKTTHA